MGSREQGRPVRHDAKRPERCHPDTSGLKRWERSQLPGISKLAPPVTPDLTPHVGIEPSGACVDGEQTLCGVPRSDLPAGVLVLTEVQALKRIHKRKRVCRDCRRAMREQRGSRG